MLQAIPRGERAWQTTAGKPVCGSPHGYHDVLSTIRFFSFRQFAYLCSVRVLVPRPLRFLVVFFPTVAYISGPWLTTRPVVLFCGPCLEIHLSPRHPPCSG